MKLYEGLFLFDANLAAKDWPGIEKHVGDLLKKNEADLVYSERWPDRKLAYEVKGCRKGTYFLTYFNASGTGISTLHRDVQLSERVLRLLVLQNEYIEEVLEAHKARAAEREAASKAASEATEREAASKAASEATGEAADEPTGTPVAEASSAEAEETASKGPSEPAESEDEPSEGETPEISDSPEESQTLEADESSGDSDDEDEPADESADEPADESTDEVESEEEQETEAEASSPPGENDDSDGENGGP